MADRKFMTDRTLQALGPADPGKRYEVFDTREPTLGVRVGDGADKNRHGRASEVTFICYTRFQKGGSPARRVIGRYPTVTLEDARAKVREWLGVIKTGDDPAVVEQRRQDEARRQQSLAKERSFAAVAKAFISQKLPGERRGNEVARDIERALLPVWADKPIESITDLDVLAVINAWKTQTPEQARALLTIAKRLFGWAIDQRIYGLKTSPCDRLKAIAIIGEKIPRQHALNDPELRAFWRSAEKLGYPFGDAFWLLALTGLRLNELMRAEWSELKDGVLTVPASRMKGRNSKARPHAVPLSADALAIIETIPRFEDARYIFSTTEGRVPSRITTEVKRRIDALMVQALESDNAPAMRPWRTHDLRRVVRSGLSALRIEHRVAEAVLAHVPPGISGVYDVYQYLDEKRAALEQWGRRLQSIVNPPNASNVIKLARG